MADTGTSVNSTDQNKIISNLGKILNVDNFVNRVTTTLDQVTGKDLTLTCNEITKKI